MHFLARIILLYRTNKTSAQSQSLGVGLRNHVGTFRYFYWSINLSNLQIVGNYLTVIRDSL